MFGSRSWLPWRRRSAPKPARPQAARSLWSDTPNGRAAESPRIAAERPGSERPGPERPGPERPGPERLGDENPSASGYGYGYAGGGGQDRPDGWGTPTGPGYDEPLAIAKGLGGRIELYHDRMRISRQGLINYVLLLLGGRVAVVDTVIAIDRISSVDITSPIIWNDFFSVSYPGGPPMVGRPLVDATSENALFLNFFDNRAMYDMVELIRRRISDPIPVAVGGSWVGRRRRGLRRGERQNGDGE